MPRGRFRQHWRWGRVIGFAFAVFILTAGAMAITSQIVPGAVPIVGQALPIVGVLVGAWFCDRLFTLEWDES